MSSPPSLLSHGSATPLPLKQRTATPPPTHQGSTTAPPTSRGSSTTLGTGQALQRPCPHIRLYLRLPLSQGSIMPTQTCQGSTMASSSSQDPPRSPPNCPLWTCPRTGCTSSQNRSNVDTWQNGGHTNPQYNNQSLFTKAATKKTIYKMRHFCGHRQESSGPSLRLMMSLSQLRHTPLQ